MMAEAKHLSIASIVSHGNSLKLETLTFVRAKENVYVIFIRRCVTSLIVIQLVSCIYASISQQVQLVKKALVALPFGHVVCL